MSPQRDLLAELIRYNSRFIEAGRNPAALSRKVERLCDSPFGFFRGTFHLFVRDWEDLARALGLQAEPQLIVGDLHVENFGAYLASDGKTVFDVNDFDETDHGPLSLDLARMATSIVLADEAQPDVRAVERIGMFLTAWRSAFAAGDLRPLGGDCEDAYVKHLVAESEAASRGRWLDKRVETTASGARQFLESEKYHRVAEGPLRRAILVGVEAYGATARVRPDVERWPVVLDVAERIAGTGSLGRHRWTVLIESRREKRGRERVLELKEALPSSLAPDRTDDAAEHVIASQHLLQGASPALLGVAHVDGTACTVRELQPTEAKVAVAGLPPTALDSLCVACGTVLGRLHRRVASAHALPAEGSDRALARSVTAFALHYAEVARADHAALRARREELMKALALSPTGHRNSTRGRPSPAHDQA